MAKSKKAKPSLLNVPMREAQKRIEAGETFTEADRQELARLKQLDREVINKINLAFRERIKHIAPWFDHSRYAWARLCGFLSQKFPGEPVDSWLDIPQDQLLGYLDSIKPPGQRDDERQSKGLELWNEGKTWTEVAELLGDSPTDSQAVAMEIKRYADSNKLEIRKGQAGRAKNK